MSHIKTIIFLCVLILLSTHNQVVQAQQHIKKVVRAGVEFGNYFSTNSGSFKREPGFTFGYLTGIRIYEFTESVVLIGIDINFTKILGYRGNVTYVLIDQYKYLYKYDERFRLSFIELGLLPEYYYSFDENTIVGIYVGGSVGIGTEYLKANLISRTQIDTTTYYQNYMYGPHGEYNMGAGRLPLSLNVGTSFYYKRLMLDFRYRYTAMNSANSYIKNFNNYSVQVGFVLY